MYDPKDYSIKKRQNRIMKKCIIILAALLLIALVLCIAQAKAMSDSDAAMKRYRMWMWNAYDQVDSLQAVIRYMDYENFKRNFNGEY